MAVRAVAGTVVAEPHPREGDLEDRLRAGRMLERCRGSEWCPFGFDQAIEAARLARRALQEGAVGYALIAARC